MGPFRGPEGEKRRHQPAEAGPHNPDVRFALERGRKIFHALVEVAGKMRDDHVRVPAPEVNRFGPLIPALQTVDENPGGHVSPYPYGKNLFNR